MSIAIIALDLSYAGTGIASWVDGRLGLETVSTRRPDHDRNGWEWPRRRRQILRRIRAVHPPGSIALCVKESRIQSLDVAGNSALDLAALHASVEDYFEVRQIPIANVNNQHVKMYASGKGSASKEWMLTQAVREMGRHIMPANDNEADALWVLQMALDRYGSAPGDSRFDLNPLRLTSSSPFRRSVLDKTRWPVWLAPRELAVTPTSSRRAPEGAPTVEEAPA